MNLIIIYVFIALLGLIIGSFINVVIYRLPIMLHQQWRQQCIEFLDRPRKKNSKKTLNLLSPRSHCPACKKKIPFYYNIPLLGFFILRGKCAHCGNKIPWRYPIVEISSCLLSLLALYYFGLTWQMGAALIFTWFLLALFFIDFTHQLLPDILTLSLLWFGLIINIFYLFTTPVNAIIGAAAGYISLWFVGWLFQKIRGIQGMGDGDYKLFAAFGAWFGWQMLPLILLIAAFIGSIVGLILLLSKKINRTTPIAFGPYLAIAGWLALFFGPTLLAIIL